jgi:hypothetical protein
MFHCLLQVLFEWDFLAISILHEISGFRREVVQNCNLLNYYAASSGYFLPTFRDNLSVPSSGLHVTQVTH